MTERRARGTSPAGRGDRRSSRSARSRPERAAGASAPAARTAAGKRAAQRRSGKSESGATAKKPARAARSPRKSEDRHERKILGLSTGRAVILAAVLCALALTLAVPMRTYFSQRAESAQLAEQRRDLEAELARLRDRRAQQQDPAYIKSEARGRLRLVMPGETPYIVQVPGIEQPAVPVQTAQPRRPDPWYTQLWRSMSNPQRTQADPEPTTPAPPPEGAPR
ncbi:septum formation initiator family protein [Nocardia sp. CDC159]|uniref:Septum formation initiator family protein n=1 Tax=Nocardia pulmonis TaxID=2951408 RepID=A0A9X2IYK8_9NOCA|nr:MULTISPECIES: septum formation initiator family protein [Nocardia]MCM6777157.1 septum formation initiator family protein [Nocardia pulmonis]MCM6790042.1 septum formation initiator family protein [Nocardia sp. CDC159]